MMPISVFTPSAQPACVLKLENIQVGAVAFCSCKPLMARASFLGPIILYKRAKNGWQRIGSLSTSYYSNLSWSIDGSGLVWMEKDQKVVVWKCTSTKVNEGTVLTRFGQNVTSISLSTGAKQVALGLLRAVEVISIPTHKTRFYSLNFPSNGTAVLFGASDDLYVAGTELLRISKGGMSSRFSFSGSTFATDVAASPDGKRLAILEYGANLELRSTRALDKSTHVWSGPGYPCGLTWSPDGRYVAIVLAANEKKGEPKRLNRAIIFDSRKWNAVASLPISSFSIGNPQFDSTSSTFSVEILGGKAMVQTEFWSTSTWKSAGLP